MMKEYVYQPKNRLGSFAEGVEELKKKGYEVVTSHPGGGVQDILRSFREIGMAYTDFTIEVDDYNQFIIDAAYTTRYPRYYPSNLKEKSLEHFVVLKLLDLEAGDIFLDVANENSPVPEIFGRLSSAKCYKQDIMFPAGVRGDTIGGDACSMPVPDGFATKIALTCSLEHFEGDADIRLFHEVHRVLKPGGIIAVVPFYISTVAFTLTDPTVSAPAGVTFDRHAIVFCREGWNNRHGRIYSPTSFMERIVKSTEGKFTFKFYYLKNSQNIDPSVYARFAFTATSNP